MSYYIYKLVCDDCDDFYVGSTKSIKDRKYEHKRTCNNSSRGGHNIKMYKHIRENGGWENWRMVIIEECDESIQTKVQAHIREETFRIQLKATMNDRRCFRTKEEKLKQTNEARDRWIQSHAEEHKARRKGNYQNNKEELLTKVTCECGCVCAKVCLTRHKKTDRHLNLMQKLNIYKE